MDLGEIILTSDDNKPESNINAWNYKTGAKLKTYKGNGNGSHTLTVLSHDYILSSQSDKPIIQAWTIHSKGQMQLKTVCPGRVTALCATPNGLYCIAGIAERILIWQVSTGNLLAVISHHFQPVTCLQTNDDGSYFLSGGQDNIIHVWHLPSVLSDDVQIMNGVLSNVSPVHTWAQHSLPVTDIYVGHGCLQARVATCSYDQTCKMFELLSGQLLISVVFEVGLTAVVMDPAELHMIVAGANGKMFLINLFEPPRSLEHHFASTAKPKIFEGHSKRITGLSVSEDGALLLSGSLDGTARLWDIGSAQIVHTFNHKGPVTNVSFVTAFETFFSNEPQIDGLSLQPFKRSLHKDRNADNDKKGQTIRMRFSDNNKQADSLMPPNRDEYLKQTEEELVDWKSTAMKLQDANKQIYSYAVERILQNN